MNQQKRFERFVRGLTALTKKHGIAIQSTGGVNILPDVTAAAHIVYSCDAGSGDLTFAMRPPKLCLFDQLYGVIHDPEGSRTWQAFLHDGRCVVIAPDFSFHSVHQSSLTEEDKPYLVNLLAIPEPVLDICKRVLAA